MKPLLSAVEVHKRRVKAMIEELGITVSVVPPPPKSLPGNDVSKVMGTRPTASAAPIEVKAVLSYPSTTRVTSPKYKENTLPLGLHETCDAVLMVYLDDALEDVNKPLGRTLFDTSKEVQVLGTTFQYEAEERTGLPPTPYILWVGLKNTGS